MGTTGASLIGVMASRSVLAVGARVPSALLGAAVAAAMVRCLICLGPVVVPGSSQVHVGSRYGGVEGDYVVVTLYIGR